MIVAAIQHPRVQIGPRRHGERLEEMREQRGRDIPHIRRVPLSLDDRVGPPGQIHRHVRQGLIHRRKAIAHADDAFAVAERVIKSLSQRQRHVLDRVVKINVQVARCLHRQVEQSVHREVGQHVVEESHARGNVVRTRAVQIQFDFDLSLIRFSRNICGSHSHAP